MPNGIVMPGDYVFLFAEGAGTLTHAGYSALGQTGTLSFSSQWVAGLFGRTAINFQSSQQLDFGTGYVNFQTNQAFSGLAWIKTSQNTGTIFEKWNVQAGVVAGQGGWQFVISGGNAYVSLTNSNGSVLRQRHGSSNVADGKWHHVLFTYDGSNTAAGIQIYVDGEAETMTTDADTDPGTLQDTNLFFGQRQGASLAFTGIIDHAIIHNGQWLAKDIAQLYAEPFLFYGRPLPRRHFFGPTTAGAGTNPFRRKRRPNRSTAFRRRRQSPAPIAIPTLNARLARREKRRQRAATFRRKRRQVQTEGLLAHSVPPQQLRQRYNPSKRRRRQGKWPYKKKTIPAPTGGCPTVTVIEAMTAKTKTIEALTATALAIERLSAKASVYEARTASGLVVEAFTAKARVVPCVKG